MTYDLFFHDYGIQGFTQRGRDFIGNILSKRPLFAPLDYREAVDRGLLVSFRNRAVANEALADPGSTSTIENGDGPSVTDVGVETPEGCPAPFVTEVPATIEDCGLEDDSPDAALCGENEDIEEEPEGM